MRILRTTSVLTAGTLLLTAAATASTVESASADPGRHHHDHHCRRPAFEALTTPTDIPVGYLGDDVQSALRGPAGGSSAGADEAWFAWNSGYLHWQTQPYLLRYDGDSVQEAPQIPVLPRMEPMSAGPLSFSSPDDGWMLSGDVGTHFFERWHDGRWTMVPAAVAADPTDTRVAFADVGAVSATDAWAVGSYYLAQPNVVGNTVRTGVAIQRFDGRQWHNVPHPLSETPDALLRGVEVLAPDDVWAVGHQWPADGSPAVPLVMHFDGTRWQEVDAPGGNGASGLRKVSAAAPDDIWAVGTQAMPGTENLAAPMALHWDGTRWSVVPGLPDFGNAALNHVSALGDGRAVAIVFKGVAYETAYWDGRRWRALSLPGPRAVGVAYLHAAMAVVDGDLITAGVMTGPATAPQPQVARMTCRRR